MLETNKILEYAQERLRYLPPRNGEGAPIVLAELDDVLDRQNNLTWYKLIYDQVTEKQEDTFRKEVMRGAVGLTERGLKDVLHMPLVANKQMVKTELRNNVGRMFIDSDNDMQAPWFGGEDPEQIRLNMYKYRILPKLEGYDLVANKEGNITFIYPPLGIIGLKVLALEGVTIARSNDHVMTHAWLASTYRNPIKELLTDENWQPYEQGKPSARQTIAEATVIGDPLSKEVLSGAGLTEEEINRLKDYLWIKTFN